MKIQFSRRFEKQYKKLPVPIQRKVKETISIFVQNPNSRRLKNHKLIGRMKHLRAIAVTGDIRIIFQEFDGYTAVIFVDVGTHSNVYS